MRPARCKQFFAITVPLLAPVIFFNLVLQMIEAFKSFSGAFIISGGRGAARFAAVLHRLSLQRGVLVPPHGLRVGAGLGAAGDHRRLHRHRLLDLEILGPLRERARLTMRRLPCPPTIRRSSRAYPRGQGAARQALGALPAHLPDRDVAGDDLSAAVDARELVQARQPDLRRSLAVAARVHAGRTIPTGWNGMAVSFATFFRNSLFVTILSVIGNVSELLVRRLCLRAARVHRKAAVVRADDDDADDPLSRRAHPAVSDCSSSSAGWTPTCR